MNLTTEAQKDAAFNNWVSEMQKFGPHKFDESDKLIWIMGYNTKEMEIIVGKINELTEPTAEELRVDFPEVVEVPNA